jgi:hypothetical protein
MGSRREEETWNRPGVVPNLMPPLISLVVSPARISSFRDSLKTKCIDALVIDLAATR